MSAPLLDMLRSRGLEPKHVANTHGGEWACPCPSCGGRDRFRVWPEQQGGPACEKAGVTGTWFCRHEQVGGDAVEYLMRFDKLNWADACKALRIDYTSTPGRLPQLPKAARPTAFTPREWSIPSDKWRERAAKVMGDAHAALLAAPNAMAWLARRGLPEEAVRRYHLGLFRGENGRQGTFRPRTVWDLPPKPARPAKDDQPAKRESHTLFIPRGIAIPCYGPAGQSEPPIRIRIRRPNTDVDQWGDKYMLVEGSCGGATMLLDGDPRVGVVVETELDAEMVHHIAGDIATVVSVLTNCGKPDVRAHEVLRRCAVILCALDFDTPGANGWAWWRQTYQTAKRWPTPKGKDAGEAFELGVDIRAWILAGLPPALTMPPVQRTSLPSVSAAPGASPSGLRTTGGGGKDDALQCPPALQPVLDIWRTMPVSLAVAGDGSSEWRFPQVWAAQNREDLHAFLTLANGTRELWAIIDRHPDAVITARNLLRRPHA